MKEGKSKETLWRDTIKKNTNTTMDRGIDKSVQGKGTEKAVENFGRLTGIPSRRTRGTTQEIIRAKDTINVHIWRIKFFFDLSSLISIIPLFRNSPFIISSQLPNRLYPRRHKHGNRICWQICYEWMQKHFHGVHLTSELYQSSLPNSLSKPLLRSV